MIRGDAVHIFGHLASFTLNPGHGIIAFCCRFCGAVSAPLAAGVPADPRFLPRHEPGCFAAALVSDLEVAE